MMGHIAALLAVQLAASFSFPRILDAIWPRGAALWRTPIPDLLGMARQAMKDATSGAIRSGE